MKHALGILDQVHSAEVEDEFTLSIRANVLEALGRLEEASRLRSEKG